MVALKVIGLAFVFFCSTSWAGEIVLSDGTKIYDPSITSDTAATTPTPKVKSTSTFKRIVSGKISGQRPSVMLGTDRMELITQLCGSAKNYQDRGYSSSKECYDAQYSKLQSERDKITADAKQKAEEEGGTAEEEKPEEQPQQAQQPQQPQQGGQPQGGDQAQQGGQQPPADAAAANAEQPAADTKGKAESGECVQIVQKLAQACQKKHDDAEKACDADQDDGLNKVGGQGDDAGKAVKKSARVNKSAVKSSILQKQTSDAVKAFGGVCQKAHESCQSECDSVRLSYDMNCKDPQKKKQVDPQVAKADESKQYCAGTLAGKAKQANDQAASNLGNANQGAEQVAGQSNGAGGGGMPDMSALAGLMKGAQEEEEDNKKEAEEVDQAFAQISANEGMSVACQRPEFQALDACNCMGLSAIECRAKKETPAPGVVQEEATVVPASVRAPASQ